MELLSPAGSMESLRAAVENGADAVYFGGSQFNARRFASNFEEDEMREAVRYCKLRGVRTNITLNTLLLDRELDDAVSYAAFLQSVGVDAVIVQDMGLIGRLRRELPELPLHASTQMGVHDAEGARLMKSLGFSRVVLSREVPLCEIANIHKSVDIEIEAFAHGALCMGFSGGCLFSSMAGERSGNRGTCAQPCRKRMGVFEMPGKTDYALSLSDLCMIEHLDDMKNAGVTSIKLEGRMKRAEYVAVVTRAYRLALDGASGEDIAREKRRMAEVFNRGGDAAKTGYFYGDSAVTDCVAKSEPDETLLREARSTYEKSTRKRSVKLKAAIRVGERARLLISCENGEGESHVYATSAVCAELAQRPQDAARYKAQLAKLGDTPFACAEEDVELMMDENAFMPVSAINELRRNAVASLEEELLKARTSHTRNYDAAWANAVFVRREPEKPAIHACVRSVAAAKAAFAAGADEVALEPWDYSLAAGMLGELQEYRRDKKLLLMLPNVVIPRAEHEKLAALLMPELLDGAVANNIGQIVLLDKLPLRIAGAALNAMNAAAVRALYATGYTRVTLSVELTKPQMRDILRSVGGAVEIYSRTPLMQLRHCPVKERFGCRDCHGSPGELMDEEARRFPLSNIRQGDSCLVRVLNCAVTDITDLVRELPTPDAVTLIMREEDAADVRERVENAVHAMNGENVKPIPNATRGHWSRAVD